MNRILSTLAAVLLLASAGRAGWEEPFRKAVSDCDRLRLRSGGTCHRNPKNERTLFETKDAAVISALIEAIEIDEEESGFGCMCCGSPTFEFYRREERLAMVGFHHGRSLRWAGGSWAGDAALTRESSWFLCRWLAEHDVKGPLAELEEEQARERAMEERMRRYGKILPKAAFAALTEADSEETLRSALLAASRDPVERVLAWFKLFGCHEGLWSRYATPDSAVEDLLDEAPSKIVGEALGRLGEDGWARGGAARWLFECRNEKKAPESALAAALPALARRAFAHPRKECRRSAMAGVARIGGGAAVVELRRLLAGEVKLRPLPEADRVDAGGMVCYRGQAEEVREAEDDRVAAAWLLGGLRDRESIPRVKALHAKAKGKDREILEAALKRLGDEEEDEKR